LENGFNGDHITGESFESQTVYTLVSPVTTITALIQNFLWDEKSMIPLRFESEYEVSQNHFIRGAEKHTGHIYDEAALRLTI